MTSDPTDTGEARDGITVGKVASVLAFAVMLAILISLGTWQAGKYLAKQPRFGKMHERLPREAIVIQSATALEPTSTDFRKVRLAGGGFKQKKTVLIGGRFWQREPGLWVLTPYVFADDSVVWVQRGWVPQKKGPAIAEDAPLPSPDFSGGFVYSTSAFEPSIHARRLARKGRLLSRSELPVLKSLDIELLYDLVDGPDPGRNSIVVLGSDFAEQWESEYPVPTDEHITDPYLTPMKHFTYAVLWYGCSGLLIWLFWAGWTGRLDPEAYLDAG